MSQQQVNDLVERFYSRIDQDEYFRRLFTERKVDVDMLKQRQRAFIARLANLSPPQEGEVDQVKERHHFGVSKEGSGRWFAHMTDAIHEMELPAESKQTLLQKIQFLLDKMVEQPKEVN
jgi:truncated hemoglobin YjbI